jgi:hypothetical protein
MLKYQRKFINKGLSQKNHKRQKTTARAPASIAAQMLLSAASELVTLLVAGMTVVPLGGGEVGVGAGAGSGLSLGAHVVEGLCRYDVAIKGGRRDTLGGLTDS